MAKRHGKGRLIVIDGSDGSGKATQAALLLSRLRKDGYRVRMLDFPRYESNLFGALIGECLAGEHGDFAGLDPKITSVLYAADRFESKATIERWLRDGCVVILDRYVSSNQIHQGGKISEPRKRREFLEWLDRMEFGVFGLPRPDAIIHLHVPTEVSRRLLAGKEAVSKKPYLRGGSRKDTLETDERYLAKSRESALRLVRRRNDWHQVECVRKGELLAREDIAEKVYEVVEGLL
ncbi:MAG: thymidylate kinase [Candidatus Moranbacteria bacterium]|nr:thymidylate kinase [Candidatus Moranbacteria bacterium]